MNDADRAIRRSPRVPPCRVAAAVLGPVSTTVLIVGTFLPWVQSGRVTRNLYTAPGIAQRIGVFGPDASVTSWLALVGPLCIVPVLLALLRLRRTAAVAGLLVALVCGAFAGTALAVAGGRSVVGVSLIPVGAVTMLVGAAALLAGAVCLLVTPRAATSVLPHLLVDTPRFSKAARGRPSIGHTDRC